MLKGHLDNVTHRGLTGWAHDSENPDASVSLLLTSNDTLVARILANAYRRDLEDAGIGNGRHAFNVTLDVPLAPLERHEIRVRRETDGVELTGSPVILEPPRVFDKNAKIALTEVLAQLGSQDDLDEMIAFLVTQTGVLMDKSVDRTSQIAERQKYQDYLRRWRWREDSNTTEAPVITQRALIIDDRLPHSDRDAGSNAILGHIGSLQRLGFEIVFIAVGEFADPDADASALDALNVTVCRGPFYGSVEEVMLRQAGTFDLVYLHRIGNAAKYGELARHYFPKARHVYSVADLHHLRFARQAAVEDRPELATLSRRLQRAELMAVASSSAVITHSTFEAGLLRKQISGSRVHVVTWPVIPAPTEIPFSQRHGVAFVGGYEHQPNVDAARWLIDTIMPLVRRSFPDIDCLLVGSGMPDHLAQMCGDGCVAVGHVDRLADVFDRVRLTIAPMAYGAGIKGKVIESLAAGVPCVCSPVGAEGLDLPAELMALVGETPSQLAALICRVHEDETMNALCATAGLNYIAERFSPPVIDAAMQKVVGL